MGFRLSFGVVISAVRVAHQTAQRAHVEIWLWTLGIMQALLSGPHLVYSRLRFVPSLGRIPQMPLFERFEMALVLVHESSDSKCFLIACQSFATGTTCDG